MDMDYAAFRNGHCIGVADAGCCGDAVEDWRNKGYEVRLMPRSEACKAHRAYLRTLPAFAGLL